MKKFLVLMIAIFTASTALAALTYTKDGNDLKITSEQTQKISVSRLKEERKEQEEVKARCDQNIAMIDTMLAEANKLGLKEIQGE